jgi:VPS62-like protein
MTNENENEILRIWPSGTTGPGETGEPHLVVSTTGNYTLVWDTKAFQGTSVSFYRPNPTDPSYFILGDYAQANYKGPAASSVIVKAVNDDPSTPLLKAPTTYRQVWKVLTLEDLLRGRGLWYPVAPDGYLTIGFIAYFGADQPSIGNYACVRQDLVEEAQPGALIWDDKGMSQKLGTIKIPVVPQVAVYKIVGASGVFVAQTDFLPYSGACFKLRGG